MGHQETWPPLTSSPNKHMRLREEGLVRGGACPRAGGGRDRISFQGEPGLHGHPAAPLQPCELLARPGNPEAFRAFIVLEAFFSS